MENDDGAPPDTRLGACYATGMGPWVIPALIAFVVLAIAFVAWELYFSRRGQRAIMEQHHIEGNDEPPKTI